MEKKNINKKCEKCGNSHNGLYGSGRFCNNKCARSFSTKLKRIEINKKVSKSLKGRSQNLPTPFWKKKQNTCKLCKKVFFLKKKNQLFCGVFCARRFNIVKAKKASEKISKERWSKINKKSYFDGKNKVGGGKTQWIEYRDIKVQGTFELRTCKILDKWKKEGKIQDWQYTNDRFEYIGNDSKKHTYLLDFKVFDLDGSFYYIEVKGYERENDKLKWKSVKNKGYKLEVWFLETIEKHENNL